MILLIDNYDSFTFNLYQYIGAIDPDIRVIRNDAMTVDQVLGICPDCVVISPGPGRPADAGICIDLIRAIAQGGPRIPVLGICLGHQGICQAFGATVGYAKSLMHGKQSMCRLDVRSKLFEGLPETVPVARYHSLAVLSETLPDCLRCTARTEDGEVMAVEHESLPIFGVQFHPESVMTPQGMDILRNFMG